MIIIGQRKNASVIGELFAGRPLSYQWQGPYPLPDETTRIYPTEKKALAAIRREAMLRRRSGGLAGRNVRGRLVATVSQTRTTTDVSRSNAAIPKGAGMLKAKESSPTQRRVWN